MPRGKIVRRNLQDWTGLVQLPDLKIQSCHKEVMLIIFQYLLDDSVLN